MFAIVMFSSDTDENAFDDKSTIQSTDVGKTRDRTDMSAGKAGLDAEKFVETKRKKEINPGRYKETGGLTNKIPDSGMDASAARQAEQGGAERGGVTGRTGGELDLEAIRLSDSILYHGGHTAPTPPTPPRPLKGILKKPKVESKPEPEKIEKRRSLEIKEPHEEEKQKNKEEKKLLKPEISAISNSIFKETRSDKNENLETTAGISVEKTNKLKAMQDLVSSIDKNNSSVNSAISKPVESKIEIEKNPYIYVDTKPPKVQKSPHVQVDKEKLPSEKLSITAATKKEERKEKYKQTHENKSSKEKQEFALQDIKNDTSVEALRTEIGLKNVKNDASVKINKINDISSASSTQIENNEVKKDENIRTKNLMKKKKFEKLPSEKMTEMSTDKEDKEMSKAKEAESQSAINSDTKHKKQEKLISESKQDKLSRNVAMPPAGLPSQQSGSDANLATSDKSKKVGQSGASSNQDSRVFGLNENHTKSGKTKVQSAKAVEMSTPAPVWERAGLEQDLQTLDERHAARAKQRQTEQESRPAPAAAPTQAAQPSLSPNPATNKKHAESDRAISKCAPEPKHAAPVWERGGLDNELKALDERHAARTLERQRESDPQARPAPAAAPVAAPAPPPATAAEVTVRHAQQRFLVNRPLSPVAAVTVETLPARPSQSGSAVETRRGPEPDTAAAALQNRIELEKELRTLDERHNTRVLNRQSEPEPRQPALPGSGGSAVPAEPHTNRPAALGPSRFDPGGPPRRNEAVAGSGGLTRSATTATASLASTPATRRKFDRNFNVSPEPFNFSSSTVSVPTPGPAPAQAAVAVAATAAVSLGSSQNSLKRNSTFSSFARKDSPSELRDATSKTMLQNYKTNPIETPSMTRRSTYQPTTAYQSSTSYHSPSISSSSYSALPPVSSLPAPTSSYRPPPPPAPEPPRARSEGAGLGAGPAVSSQYRDFYTKIQASKDRHKSDVERAMSFDRSAASKPVVRQARLPRPDHRYDTASLARRQDREQAVLSAILSDRTSRDKSGGKI